MIDQNEARRLVEERLRIDAEDDVAVIEALTLERPFGWVFFYNTRECLESGSASSALAGNAPYIVNRFSGAVIATGTAYTIEHYVSAYEAEL